MKPEREKALIEHSVPSRQEGYKLMVLTSQYKLDLSQLKLC